MKKRPRGNCRSKVLVERDMIAIVERMQLHGEDAKDAGKALGIPATTAQRLARKGLLRVLGAAATETIKAIADADSHPNPMQRGQFELPEPESVQATPPQVVFLPAPEVQQVQANTVAPAPEGEPWEWEHLMSREEFLKRDPWRQKQLIAGWQENAYLSGKPFVPVLRGKPNRGVCFGKCPPYACTCHDEGAFEL